MVDIRDYTNALKITWLRRLLVSDNSCGWVFLYHKTMDISGMFPLEGGSFKLLYSHKNRNLFLRDVFTSWSKFTLTHTTVTAEDVSSNTLWHNDTIKVCTQFIYYKHWESAGVKYIFDLLDDNGKFLQFDDFRNKFNIYKLSYWNTGLWSGLSSLLYVAFNKNALINVPLFHLISRLF